MKRFVALARVSSREQEREGFSLQVQEDALKRYAEAAGGVIVQFIRIAETASKKDERKSFRELVSYAKKHARTLDGLLFYKVDRAARNIFDYVELERLEGDYGIPFISVSQPTDATPAGRMMRRTLANMASFFTEQQSLDVREGIQRRVSEGWFVGRPPYGYCTRRVGGRSVVFEKEPEAATVRRMFEVYAHSPVTLDMLIEQLEREGFVYRASNPKFVRSTVYHVLTNRSYVGDISIAGEWKKGKHEPLVSRRVFERVQKLLGGHSYHAHESVYASGLITCACGRVVTGEVKYKPVAGRVAKYTYYRCSGYNLAGHARLRISERELDKQVLAVFDSIRLQDADVRSWFADVLVAASKKSQADSGQRREELLRQEKAFVTQEDRLLNMRICGEISGAAYNQKSAEIRGRLESVRLNLEALGRTRDETASLALRVFELSQRLKDAWVTADFTAKRRLLDLVFLNLKFDGVNLVPTMNKPFDVLAEGLIFQSSRGDRI